MDARTIVKQLLSTEKSVKARTAESKYSFVVDREANKHQIKEAVERLFKVHVAGVQTVIMPGKVKRMGRFEGKSATWKKAVVKLKAGEKIAEFENV
ncbi:MAG: 50S ribosomal protein L23 [candidate division Zixibacteria bacterium]|nr:50S ribosomal protein L23 [candidate division Zixibacteria bacterium]